LLVLWIVKLKDSILYFGILTRLFELQYICNILSIEKTSFKMKGQNVAEAHLDTIECTLCLMKNDIEVDMIMILDLWFL
jgi:excinuclease UvrABC helicase subunit UvrB